MPAAIRRGQACGPRQSDAASASLRDCRGLRARLPWVGVSARNLLVVACGLGLGLAFGACNDGVDDGPGECRSEARLQLFDSRIAPLLREGNQSACNECHLAGVDLGLYASGGSECATMACMVEAGIVDLEQPADSRVLGWILRATPESELITPEVVQAEHDGVLEWIQLHAECGADLCPPIDDPCGRESTPATCETPPAADGLPARGFDDPGDCSDLTIERAFGELVYSWRGRCFPCHYDGQRLAPENAPRWIIEGDCNIGSLSTMRRVLDDGLVDLENPAQSLLLLKPLSEAAGGLPHEGSDKFFDTSDGAYQDFRTWLELIGDCQSP